MSTHPRPQDALPGARFPAGKLPREEKKPECARTLFRCICSPETPPPGLRVPGRHRACSPPPAPRDPVRLERAHYRGSGAAVPAAGARCRPPGQAGAPAPPHADVAGRSATVSKQKDSHRRAAAAAAASLRGLLEGRDPPTKPPLPGRRQPGCPPGKSRSVSRRSATATTAGKGRARARRAFYSPYGGLRGSNRAARVQGRSALYRTLPVLLAPGLAGSNRGGGMGAPGHSPAPQAGLPTLLPAPAAPSGAGGSPGSSSGRVGPCKGDPRDPRPVDGRTAGAKPCRALRTAPGMLALGSVFPSSCPAPGARPRSWRRLFVPCRRASGSPGRSSPPAPQEDPLQAAPPSPLRTASR